MEREEIEREVMRLQARCFTEEGKAGIVADYIFRLLREQESQLTMRETDTPAELAAKDARIAELEAALKQAKWCIDEMAYFAHDMDISDAEALRKIKHAWTQVSVAKIDELLAARAASEAGRG